MTDAIATQSLPSTICANDIHRFIDATTNGSKRACSQNIERKKKKKTYRTIENEMRNKDKHTHYFFVLVTSLALIRISLRRRDFQMWNPRNSIQFVVVAVADNQRLIAIRFSMNELKKKKTKRRTVEQISHNVTATNAKNTNRNTNAMRLTNEIFRFDFFFVGRVDGAVWVYRMLAAIT